LEDTIKILAIDPGGNTGVSIFTITVPSLIIVNVETTFIDLSYFDIENGYEKLKNKLLGLEQSIQSLIECYQPHILAIEDTFVNYRFPKSAIYLSQYIATIELTVMRYNRFISIFKYAPKLIKKYMTGKGNADKDDMLAALLKNNEILPFVKNKNLTEHEIDSLAIGYLAIVQLRTDNLLLLTI